MDSPFWSPDSRSIAFVADGKLKKISVAGGPVTQFLVDTPVTPVPGTWNREGINSLLCFAIRAPKPSSHFGIERRGDMYPTWGRDGRELYYAYSLERQESVAINNLSCTDSCAAAGRCTVDPSGVGRTLGLFLCTRHSLRSGPHRLFLAT